MKTKYIFALFTLLAITVSCTDVVDVEVPEGPTRLTIEASLDWERGTSGNTQTILLSTSTPFFNDEKFVPATGAIVRVTNTDNGTEFVFDDQNNGRYTTSDFIPIIGNTYSLEIQYEGERYTATETLYPVSEITEITQSTEDGEDDEALEVNVSFLDPADIENYYFLRMQRREDLFPELFYIKDEFIDGNEFTIYYEKIDDEEDNSEEFKPGDIVDISFMGISKQYHDYLRLLIEQYESAGEPFSPPPVPLIGNCINEDNPDNTPYGYFRVTEKITDTYTFQ
ncbi:DUF4249 domain-containing protein [Flagellimonas nanhaiensis]|uniref:DUF4249 domain-containing protein n=1 Tax=Flagellimonas nanhaiensis TaxID=2292706 RepID=A0A371JTS1_9FLAO|nr:DUF4249 domain-containing protein [Allomuricauda nanhaiensis]RDY61176.1 DUF4249 domain-containing protein [Allomuricauda nanhaiensis]